MCIRPPYEPSCLSVGWLFGHSCKGRVVTAHAPMQALVFHKKINLHSKTYSISSLASQGWLKVSGGSSLPPTTKSVPSSWPLNSVKTVLPFFQMLEHLYSQHLPLFQYSLTSFLSWSGGVRQRGETEPSEGCSYLTRVAHVATQWSISCHFAS